MSWKLVLTTLAVVFTAVALLRHFARRQETSAMAGASGQNDTYRRLAARLADGRDYLVFVGVPLQAPTKWSRAIVTGPVSLSVGEAGINLSEVRAFLIAYPSGEILDRAGPLLGAPEGLRSLEPAETARDVRIRDRDVADGNELVAVTYGPSKAHPNERSHFSTTLTNLSKVNVRVRRFGGFVQHTNGEWLLSTVTGDLYSEEQFREWYGQRGAWLAPGQAATDPNNYGSTPAMWAYFFETEDGRQFVAGAIKQR